MKKIILLIALLALFLIACGQPAHAASSTATLGWAPVTTNTDGSGCTDLQGYNVYRASGSNGTYSKIGTVGATTLGYIDAVLVPNNTTITVCYVVTAFDSYNESGYSNQVCKSFFGADTISPAPPTNLTVQ